MRGARTHWLRYPKASLSFARLHSFFLARSQSTNDSACVCIRWFFHSHDVSNKVLKFLANPLTVSDKFYKKVNTHTFAQSFLQSRCSIYFGQISEFQTNKFISVCWCMCSISRFVLSVNLSWNLVTFEKNWGEDWNKICTMRSLWIAIVLALALFECSCEEDSTVSEALIDDVFNRDTQSETDVKEGSSSSPPPPLSEKPHDTPTAEDPTLEQKSSNVSQWCEPPFDW